MTTPLRYLAPRALILCGLLALTAHAQTPDLAGVVQQLNALKAEVAVTRAENAALRQQLDTVAAATSADHHQKWPEIRVNALGSIEYAVNNVKGEPSGIALGDIDLVTTARLNEQASATMDYVVASNHGGFAYEIERLVGSYKISDHLNADFGRFHTAMGWYNNFYHNGTYFQTTRDRPELYVFEDNSGILPVHSTGVSLNGDIPSGSANLSFSLELSNGRRYTANEDEALQIEDDNNSKAVNFQLRAKPDDLANWQFGVGAYHDSLSPELDATNDPGVTTHVDQLILSAYAVYKSPVIEWFTEGAYVGDKADGDTRHWTFAGYTQLSHKFGRLRPYVRFQVHAADEHDPVMELIGRDHSSWDTQVGLRYDFTTMMALKFEFDHGKVKHEAATNEYSSQLAFRF